MSALDMLANAPHVSSDDIVARQVKIRRRAEAAATTPGKEYKAKFRDEKSDVIEAFHRYAAANPFSAAQASSLQAWVEESATREAAPPNPAAAQPDRT
jgi:hypothetical protein